MASRNKKNRLAIPNLFHPDLVRGYSDYVSTLSSKQLKHRIDLGSLGSFTAKELEESLIRSDTVGSQWAQLIIDEAYKSLNSADRAKSLANPEMLIKAAVKRFRSKSAAKRAASGD